jgi:hypothetical protein
MRWSRSSETLRCSFCHKSQDVVSKLISSPSDFPRAYICGECVDVCQAILEDDEAPPGIREIKPPPADHPLLRHPFASRFFTAVELWIRHESKGEESSKELSEVRHVAALMLNLSTQT